MDERQYLTIQEVGRTDHVTRFDFFVDGEALSSRLAIDRLDLAYCGFDLDLIEVDQTRFPHYDRKVIIQRSLAAFLGKEKAVNQFGSGRVVLYRCHCGCDYCGVISFRLTVLDHEVIWSDLRYEADGYEDSEEASLPNRIEEIRFDRSDYEQAFAEYAKTWLT